MAQKTLESIEMINDCSQHCSFCSDCSDRRAAGRPLKAGQFLDQDRKDVLKAGILNLVRMTELRERESQSRPEMDIPKSPSGSAHPDKRKVRLGLTITKHVPVNFQIFGISCQKKP